MRVIFSYRLVHRQGGSLERHVRGATTMVSFMHWHEQLKLCLPSQPHVWTAWMSPFLMPDAWRWSIVEGCARGSAVMGEVHASVGAAQLAL
jgi:hypothetical protein